jgi:hypothetical protein
MNSLVTVGLSDNSDDIKSRWDNVIAELTALGRITGDRNLKACALMSASDLQEFLNRVLEPKCTCYPLPSGTSSECNIHGIK